MREEDLSPAAQKELERLTPSTNGDFFKWLMPDAGREVARKRFMEFLRHEAREDSNPFFGFPSGDEEDHQRIQKRDEWIEARAQSRFDALGHPDIPMSQAMAYDIGQRYRAWWKRRACSNSIASSSPDRRAGACGLIDWNLIA